MKLIIAGSRGIKDRSTVYSAFLEALKSWGRDEADVNVIVSGMASGPDMLGVSIAKQFRIPVTRFYADWNRYGKAAGPRRNRAMAEYADAAVIVWDGKSRGSANMRDEMLRLGKPVYVAEVRA